MGDILNRNKGAARLSTWTAIDAQRFWYVTYAYHLEAACVLSKSAHLIAALIARRSQPPARVLLIGDRDPTLAEALLAAGFLVARVDIGPWLVRPESTVETHEQWLGHAKQLGAETFDIVLSVGILECLHDDEINPFLNALRCSVGEGGCVIVGVPNNERLEQQQAVCPRTGFFFHSCQRVRPFVRESLSSLLAGFGLETIAELEIELDENVLAKHVKESPDFAVSSYACVGAGTTLFSISKPEEPPKGSAPVSAVSAANDWLALRRELISASSVLPTPERWNWTPESVGLFWSRISGTPLDDLSFGKVLGQTMLRGVEPWLVPGRRHLDVGAGEGHMAEIMAAAGYPVAALEPAAERAKTIEAKLGGVKGFLGRLNGLDDKSKGTFDVVLACEVIEHVLDDDLANFFELLASALTPGGRIILSTPNREDLSRGEVYSPFGNVIFHRWQHVRSLSVESLAALLRQHGFEPDAMHQVDLAAAERRAMPELESILGSVRQQMHGSGANLVAIAHRSGQAVQPPRNLSIFERMIAPPRRAGDAPPLRDEVLLNRGQAQEIRAHATIELDLTKAERVGKHARRLLLPDYLLTGDSIDSPSRSGLRLFEDGAQLGPAHSTRQSVAEIGRGRYLHWGRELDFSSSDGSDPRSNGRRYIIVAEGALSRTVNLDDRLRPGGQMLQVWEVPANSIVLGSDRLGMVSLPAGFPPGDNATNPCRSVLELFEDGVPLGPAHSLHDDISRLGEGRYSHGDGCLYFSSSDGSDPRSNGRRYVALARLPFAADSTVRRFLGRATRSSLRAGKAVARTCLPVSVRARLIKPALALEAALAHPHERSFDSRPVPLVDFKPALLASAFSGGPVVLCNNALAWGGVERQVVNTMRGIAARLPRPPHLLCVRLGCSADYDFYKEALAEHPGEVRNVMDLASARRALTELETGLDRRIAEATVWLPADVQEEIIRFAGDFATLKPSVVHVWQDALSISAGYAARMMGVPCILVSSRNMAAKRFAYHRPYMASAYQEILRCSDIIMLNNSEAGARDYANWLGVSADRYRIVRNGVDDAIIRQPEEGEICELRSRLGLTPDTLVVGSIFRFYPEKRPRLWIETAARIAAERSDCHFVVFGTGPMKDEMLTDADNHGFADRIHLPGTISNAALGLSIMDLFLLTSELEGTPNVVLEASLMGVPVVAADAGGTAETIDEGTTGFVAAEHKPELLSSLALSALSDTAWRLRVREAGPKFVRTRFGLDRMLNETLELYHI